MNKQYTKKVVKLNTYYCDLCEYKLIDDKETKFLRAKNIKKNRNQKSKTG